MLQMQRVPRMIREEATMATLAGSGVNLNSLDRARAKLGLEWDEIAAILGVNRSTVHRWRTHEAAPRPIAWTRIAQLGELMQLLPRIFAGPDLARKWLREARPELLGGKATPLDVMLAGRLDRVLMVLEFLERGA